MQKSEEMGVHGEAHAAAKEAAHAGGGTKVAEEKQMSVEEELAERYAVPVEIFQVSDGVGSTCLLVAGIGGFEGAQRIAASASASAAAASSSASASASAAASSSSTSASAALNVYLMPYLSLDDAKCIAQKLEKSEDSQSRMVIVHNRELLACKLRALDAMKAEMNKEPLDGEHSRLLSKFRNQLENRLLIAHTLRGNTKVALKFHKILHPDDSDRVPIDKTEELMQHTLLESVNNIQKQQYPYPTSDETDIHQLNHDLICIIATQASEDEAKVGCKQLEEHSLIGAANSKMAADALRRHLDYLMATVISKKFLEEDFCYIQLKPDLIASQIMIKSFCDKGNEYIVKLSELLEMRSNVDYDELSNIAELFQHSAISAGATKVISLCKQFEQICKERARVENSVLPPWRRLTRLLPDIHEQFRNVKEVLKTFKELHKLISHYDSRGE